MYTLCGPLANRTLGPFPHARLRLRLRNPRACSLLSLPFTEPFPSPSSSTSSSSSSSPSRSPHRRRPSPPTSPPSPPGTLVSTAAFGRWITAAGAGEDSAIRASLFCCEVGIWVLKETQFMLIYCLPIYLIVTLGCYGLLMVGVGLMFFPTCPQEAVLLQQDIAEAREFLIGKAIDVGSD
uniref:Dolichol-phosphate mannosyltransferase subunit 3 n=1 Tax=Ananas comosus var. bracteatus TaxID=296719 RepID=A0A6V7PN03_ANACO|nr:unnamed protein product [Ananas comosus var. bracteatus]